MAFSGDLSAAKCLSCWISDILSKNASDVEGKDPEQEGRDGKGQLFSVVGVVVDIRNDEVPCWSKQIEEGSMPKKTPPPVIYEVDDGTGVLTVAHFLSYWIKDQHERGLDDVARALSGSQLQRAEATSMGRTPNCSGLSMLTNRALELHQKSCRAFRIGQAIEAKGRLKVYRSQWQMTAISVREVPGPRLEILRPFLIKRLQSFTSGGERPKLNSELK